MAERDFFVRMALNAWDLQVKRASKGFEALTDEQMLEKVAPGKNRAVYLLGHLIAVNDAMIPLFGLGERHYPQLEEVFLTRPDNAVSPLPATQTLRQHWKDLNQTLSRHFIFMPANDWFGKHASISSEDFAKEPHRNKLSVLMNRTSHMAYHLGQLMLLKT